MSLARKYRIVPTSSPWVSEDVDYTVIKHNGHLRTRGKSRKHEPQASVFDISRVFYQSVVRGLGFFICFMI